MIIFKTFLKILNACKFPVIMYTVILVVFGAFNMETSEKSMSFSASKPDVFIVNEDRNIGITEDFIKYISSKSNIKELSDSEDVLNDALFYRDVNYIIYIPKGFRESVLNGSEPRVLVKSTGDYQASLAQIMVNKYLKLLYIYSGEFYLEEDIINAVNETLVNEIDVEVNTNLDTEGLTKATFYFNFANYSILAGLIYTVCIILSSFKSKNIDKRTIVSSVNYKKLNKNLLLSNGLFAFSFWLCYVILGFVLVGSVMFSLHGVFYILNSLLLTISALALAFLIGNLVRNKDAVNAVVTVLALGTSFLCGSFVPTEFLPKSVLSLAHVFPSYYYINTNNIIKTIEVFNFENLSQVLFNMFVLVVFIIIFVILSNLVTKYKRENNL